MIFFSATGIYHTEGLYVYSRRGAELAEGFLVKTNTEVLGEPGAFAREKNKLNLAKAPGTQRRLG
jgi:hypothetical protein